MALPKDIKLMLMIMLTIMLTMKTKSGREDIFNKDIERKGTRISTFVMTKDKCKHR